MGYMRDRDGVRLDSVAVTTQAKPLWIDTDYSTDCDDAAAVRYALAQARMGMVDVRLMISSSTNLAVAKTIQAHCIDEERSDIPVAAVTSGVNSVGNQNTYLAREYAWTSSSFPDPVTAARTEMAAGTSKGGVYVCIGYPTALAAILQSPADGISPLTGRQLFDATFSRCIVMGSNVPNTSAEHNFQGDVAAAAYVMGNPPACGIELHPAPLGSTIVSGLVLNTLEQTDLVRRAFEVTTIGSPNNLAVGRASFDPMAVVSACADSPEAVGLARTYGTVTVDGGGLTSFTANQSARTFYVTKTGAITDTQYAAMINACLVPGYEPRPPRKTTLRPLNNRKTPWTPFRLSSAPFTWLRGEELGSVGSKIASWPTPYGVSATANAKQATAANQPTVARGYGERLCAAFTGAQWLDFTTYTSYPNPLLVVVFSSSQGSGVGAQVVAAQPQIAGANTSPFFRYGVILDATLKTQMYVNGTAYGAGIVRDWTRPRMVEADCVPCRLFVDGQQEVAATSPSSSVTFPNSTNLRIGADGAGGQGFTGYIYEVIGFNGLTVSMSERLRLREYIGRKYGTPVSNFGT